METGVESNCNLPEKFTCDVQNDTQLQFDSAEKAVSSIREQEFLR